MRCSICGEKIRANMFTWWLTPHFRSVHPDYSRWFANWARSFYAFITPLILGMVLADYAWFSISGPYEALAGIMFLLFIGFCFYEINIVLRRNVRKYARQWRDQHSPNKNVQL